MLNFSRESLDQERYGKTGFKHYIVVVLYGDVLPYSFIIEC
jgi:hypothetical protein